MDCNNIQILLNRLSPPSITRAQQEHIIQQYSKQSAGISRVPYLELLSRIVADMHTSSDVLLLAGRLLVEHVRRNVCNVCNACGMRLCDRIHYLATRGVYDVSILAKYTKSDIERIEREVYKDELDYTLPYVSARVFRDKYLLKDADGNILETPQQANVVLCMCVFMNEDDDARRMHYISRMYDYLSHFVINLPTPLYAGLRTTLKSYSSCCVLDIGDDSDSILSTAYMAGKAVTHRYGIGFNCCRLSNNILQVLKLLEASTKTFTQGVRSGSACASFPFWHIDIQLIVQLKNNRGVVENRVRNIDYSIGVNRLFLERALNNKNISLFKPCDVPLLSNSSKYSSEDFRRIYVQYEASTTCISISALELLKSICKERYETGRVYIYFMDNINTYSPFTNSIFSPNLCQEIFLPTQPSYIYPHTQGLAGVCILASVNVGRLIDTDNFTDMQDIAYILVRALNNVIDMQDYAFPQLADMAKHYRPLGIGISDLFHLLAIKHLKHNTADCRKYVHRMMEHWQYYLIEASCNLAAEHGKCSAFDECCRYARGVLPLYKSSVDDVCDNILEMDWSVLDAKVKKYGMRNTCLSAVPPTSSSSAISNSTPGIDPPRSLLTTKLSKAGTVYSLVPDHASLAQHYETAQCIDNAEYIKLVGVIQKFVDQGISTSTYYLGGTPSVGDIIKEITTAYSYGLKSLYYLNTTKGIDDASSDVVCSEGACTI